MLQDETDTATQRIVDAIDLFAEPNQLIELRVPDHPDGVQRGYFTAGETSDRAALAALEMNEVASVYVTLNPIQRIDRPINRRVNIALGYRFNVKTRWGGVRPQRTATSWADGGC